MIIELKRYNGVVNRLKLNLKSNFFSVLLMLSLLDRKKYRTSLNKKVQTSLLKFMTESP